AHDDQRIPAIVFCVRRRTSSPATLTSRVIRTSVNAAYINALTCIPEASPNWLARSPAKVPAGESKDQVKRGLLPINIATAIVSPIARPKARMVAATIPGAAVGSSTRKIVSQRVAPTAYEPSLKVWGTETRAVRLIAVIVGRTMSESTK